MLSEWLGGSRGRDPIPILPHGGWAWEPLQLPSPVSGWLPWCTNGARSLGVPCHILKASSLCKTPGFRGFWAQQCILEIYYDTIMFLTLWFAFCPLMDSWHCSLFLGWVVITLFKASLQIIRDSQKWQHKDTDQQTDVWKFQYLHRQLCLILPSSQSLIMEYCHPWSSCNASLGYRNAMEHEKPINTGSFTGELVYYAHSR